jgi:hypothetical protein
MAMKNPTVRKALFAGLAGVVATAVVWAPTKASAAPHTRAQLSPTTTQASVTPARRPVGALKIVNYYPSNAGWTDMWTNYSHATTVADFTAIKSLGANTVRVIVQPSAVGYPNVAPSMRTDLDDMISVAGADGLSVQLTLFDMWSGYTDILGSEQWLQSLLAGETTNPTIAVVELKNEMPLSTLSVAWATALMPFLQSVLPGVPRTISEPGTGGASALQTLLTDLPTSDIDAVDVHYYGDPALAGAELQQVKTMAGTTPVFIGETGVSTYGTSAGEEAQTRFYEVMGQTAKDLGLAPPSPWMLNDVTRAGGENLTTQQEYYGLRRADGSWKPAASVISQLFAGGSPQNWDGNMSKEASDLPPVLGSWTEFDAADGTPTITPGMSYNGGQSLCFSNTGGTSAKLPSVEQGLPVLSSNEVFTVTAWINRTSSTGNDRISIAGFNSSDQYIGETDSAAATTTGNWQELSATGMVPQGISSVQIHLKTGNQTGTACWSDVSITYTAP